MSCSKETEEPEHLPEDPERCCANIMEEVQKVTRQNIELSSSYEERLRSLEADLQNVMSIQQRQGIAPTWMLHQLEALESDCDGLERRWRQVQGQRKGEEHRLIQRLRSEHESQLQELGRLRETIKESKEEKPSPPSLEPLEQEAAELRREIEELQRRKHAEEAHAEQQRLALKVEIGSLQEQLQQTLSQKSVMEDVVEGLKSSHSATADSSREVRELQQHQEFLEKECVRSERRIIILDEKIDSLSKEAEDLRQRATVVLSALPDAQDSEACGLQHKQRQVQELRREQAQLQKEQEAADQEFEAAKVEASVLERKIRSLGALPSDR